MKRVLFLIVIVLMSIPARAEDVTPTTGTLWYESLTYTVTVEPIKGWWKGSSVRMAAIGNIYCAFPDASSVLDLYECGFTAAIFKREKKNVISLPRDDKDIIKYWFSENDFISVNANWMLPDSKFIADDESSLKVEYARKLGDSFAIGVKLGYEYRFFKSSIAETYYSGFDMSNYSQFEWLISMNWAGNGLKVFELEYGVSYAVAIGNLKNSIPIYEALNFNGKMHYYDEISSYFDYSYEENLSTTEINIYELNANRNGFGLAYAFSVLDINKQKSLLFRVNFLYDWQSDWESYKYSSISGESRRVYNRQELFINGLLEARILFADSFTLAVIKNLIFNLEWGKNTDTGNMTLISIQQPLVLEVAYINNIVKIPIAYSDFYLGATIKTGVEFTLFKCLDLRLGCNFLLPTFPNDVNFSYGAGIELMDFSLNVVFNNRGNGGQFKWAF